MIEIDDLAQISTGARSIPKIGIIVRGKLEGLFVCRSSVDTQAFKDRAYRLRGREDFKQFRLQWVVNWRYTEAVSNAITDAEYCHQWDSSSSRIISACEAEIGFVIWVMVDNKKRETTFAINLLLQEGCPVCRNRNR